MLSAFLVSLTPGADRRLATSLDRPMSRPQDVLRSAERMEPLPSALARIERMEDPSQEREATRLSGIERQIGTNTGSVGEIPAGIAQGINLGRATTPTALRSLWQTLVREFPSLQTLTPRLAVIEPQTGAIEFHLLAGPLLETDAARLCEMLAARKLHCEKAVYDGQRLAN